MLVWAGAGTHMKETGGQRVDWAQKLGDLSVDLFTSIVLCVFCPRRVVQ